MLTAELSARGADWFRWRGPNLDGISNETGWAANWPKDGPPVVWKASVGTGFSSMTVAGGRLYTMGNEDSVETVYCLDAATGAEIWTHSYECPLDDRFFEGGPTATPTADSGAVYTISRQGDLFCFDAQNGKVRWSKNIQRETGVRIPGWGFSASPLVHGDLLLLNAGDAGTALNKTTGKVVWTSGDGEAGYTTPLPVRRVE